MNFPGRVHVHKGGLSGFVIVIAFIIVAIIALAWNVYTSINGPMPVAERVTPSRYTSNRTGKTLIDIVERDANKLARGDILASPPEKDLGVGTIIRSEQQGANVQQPVSDNYYKTEEVKR